VSQFAPHVPRILVGCKTDLREDGEVLDDGTSVRMLTPEDVSALLYFTLFVAHALLYLGI
jgi:hypothetical protein